MTQEEFAKKNIIPLLAVNHFHYSDNKTPFNYINYWNYINDEYFQKIKAKNFSNTDQIIHKIISNGKFFYFYFFFNFFFLKYRKTRNAN